MKIDNENNKTNNTEDVVWTHSDGKEYKLCELRNEDLLNIFYYIYYSGSYYMSDSYKLVFYQECLNRDIFIGLTKEIYLKGFKI